MINSTQCQDILAVANSYCNTLPGRLLPIPAGQKATKLKGWPAAASNDPEQVAAWFEHSNSNNLGIVPNRGVFVLDLDQKHGKNGFESIANLEKQFGALPHTLTASTPSSGEHRYFRGPADLPYRTCSDAAGLAGVDFRCAPRLDGSGAGYCVMPPSETAAGSYRWQNWPNIAEPPHIAEAPRWLIELAAGGDPRKRLADRDHDEDPDRIAHLADALQRLDCAEYDSWISIGLSLKTLDDDAAGLKLWLDWSSRSPKFDEADARKRWAGFAPKNTSWRLIFTLAQALGWQNPGRAKPSSGVSRESSAIAEFNKRHAVVITGGAACIMREGTSESGGSAISFANRANFSLLYENRFATVQQVTADGEIQTKRMPWAKFWLSHPERRTHDGVTFAPTGPVPQGYYNLWRGYAVKPLSKGVAESALACKRFLHHLKTNICRGNKSHFRYLLAWMADMVQDPTQKKGVALVLRGKKGTGKSTLTDALRALLDGHAFKASKSEHIVGRFSAHLADKLLLVAEESFFAGSHADIGTLKDLITSGSITIEPKFVGAFEMRSCHRVIMCTNSEWAVPATEEERRFFVLDVGEDHMQDFEYFSAIDRELRGDGLRALLTLLQKFDISGVNLRKIPHTQGLDAQKVLSLESHDQFILDCLTGEEICEEAWASTEAGPLRSDVYAEYVRYARASSVRPISANRFGPIFLGRTGAVTYQPGGTDRRRRYILPSAEEALARMRAQLGIRPDVQ